MSGWTSARYVYKIKYRQNPTLDCAQCPTEVAFNMD